MNRRKLKENPMIKEDKKVKNINAKNLGVSEDENEIKSFIIIVIVIAVIAGIVYFVTELVANKEPEYQKTVTQGEVDYDIVSVGTLLNRPYDDYYVLVYDADSDDAMKYSTTMSKYIQNNSKEDNYKKIYFCNLGNFINSAYYNVGEDNKSNPKATKIEDFDFGDLTLLQIKKGKVVKYVEDYTIIQDLLK